MHHSSWWRRIVVAAASFAFAATMICPAMAQATTGTITGTVTSSAGAPVSGASISIKGAAAATATTDDKGAFSASVAPGLYDVTVSKGGYQSASQTDVTVAAGSTQPVTITLAPVDLSTLRTIGTVTSVGRASSFNTGAARIVIIFL